MHFKEKLKTFRANLIGLDPGFMSIYCKLFFKPEKGTIQELINNHAKGKKHFSFLQIGGNDGFIKEDQCCISSRDRGFLLGDGLFETLRCFDASPEYFALGPCPA